MSETTQAQRTTPETDAHIANGEGYVGGRLVHADFARSLERDRDEWRESSAGYASDLEQCREERDALAERVKVREAELRAERLHVERSTQILANIYGLMAPEDVESDGTRFMYKPPDDLLYETWRRLSAAIRAIPEQADVSRLATLTEAAKLQGHDEPCYFCGKKCNELAGNPSEWPVPLTHSDDPGKVKWHHMGCVSRKLEAAKRLAQAGKTAYDALMNLQSHIAQLPKQYQPFIDSHVDVAMKALKQGDAAASEIERSEP